MQFYNHPYQNEANSRYSTHDQSTAGVMRRDVWLELGSQSAATGHPIPIRLKLNSDVMGRRLFLQSYTVKGYPTTSNIPDSTHYKLRILSDGEKSEKGGSIFASRHTGTAGTVGTNDQIQIPLEAGGYTHRHLGVPQREVYTKHGADGFHIKSFEVIVTDEDDNAAEFTDLNLLLRVE